MKRQDFQLATLCYIKKDQKTLMLHRTKKKNDVHAGKWNGLGGKFLPGETPEACVRREVQEESGYHLTDLQFRGILLFPNFTPTKDWMVFVFESTGFMGSMRDTGEGHLKWIEDDQLPNLNLWEGDRIFMKWLKKPDFFSARFTYKEKKYLSHEVVFYPGMGTTV